MFTRHWAKAFEYNSIFCISQSVAGSEILYQKLSHSNDEIGSNVNKQCMGPVTYHNYNCSDNIILCNDISYDSFVLFESINPLPPKNWSPR